jgi:L-2,4-diaminobutyrate decarboxylase
MDPQALRRALAAHGGPAAVVATAGTTDAGAVDPLPDIAAVAREHGAWLHVDAAYGGGALLSDRLRGLLAGIGDADSVGLDLHKLGWQPVPAGVFLTRDAASWGRLDTEVAYLNPADDTEAGLVSLLGRSLRTTRRPDAFPVAVTLRALGRRGLGALVDACHDLALHAAAAVEAHPHLELAVPVTLTTVVFRYHPPGTPPSSAGTPPSSAGTPPSSAGTPPSSAGGAKPVPPSPDAVAAPSGHHLAEKSSAHENAAVVDAVDPDKAIDAVNAELRRRLLVAGRAVVGRTEIGADRRVHLKLTLLNPNATTRDVDALLSMVAATGDAVAADGDFVGRLGGVM